MMMVITKQDLAKMSVELRQELMMLMFEPEDDNDEAYLDDVTNIEFEEHEQEISDMHESTQASYELTESKNKKRVIGISPDQAKALIANLSDKSINTLKLFTSDDSVSVGSLVGEGKPYATYVELKRSFVGPVNRRLRTVTRNRTAVLFKKTDAEEDSEISVKQETAISLSALF